VSHALIELLDELGAIRKEELKPFYPRVRDRDDIEVLRCDFSEVIVLSSIAHVEATQYYEERSESSALEVNGDRVVTPRLGDNLRRAADFGHLIRGKRWLDFGCGLGGMLDELAADAASVTGLEPNRDRAGIVSARGHRVVAGAAELDAESLDVITMFHVLEHLAEPLAVLRDLKSRLAPGGTLLIEVPHARDALFTLYDCEAFKAFTFWSEHLVLHTRTSLRLLLAAAGFQDVEISGYQRYPLANHLYWLSRGRPGGQEQWSLLSTMNGGSGQGQYENDLGRLDRTDTLIALARVTPPAQDTPRGS
jgi:2-polyprenyl-3-methyl-5-hydroxy-6-metoxy-1,4-benzoquinol methylase